MIKLLEWLSTLMFHTCVLLSNKVFLSSLMLHRREVMFLIFMSKEKVSDLSKSVFVCGLLSLDATRQCVWLGKRCQGFPFSGHMAGHWHRADGNVYCGGLYICSWHGISSNNSSVLQCDMHTILCYYFECTFTISLEGLHGILVLLKIPCHNNTII